MNFNNEDVCILVKSEGDGTEVRSNIGLLKLSELEKVVHPIIVVSKNAFDEVYNFLQPLCRHENILLRNRGLETLVIGEGLISRALERITKILK